MLAPLLALAAEHHHLDGYVVTILLLICGFSGIVFSYFNWMATARVSLDEPSGDAEDHLLIHDQEKGVGHNAMLEKVRKINSAISVGSNAFLFAEYKFMFYFMVAFGALIVVLIGATANTAEGWKDAALTSCAFLIGCSTSILSGWVGMKIAVFANARVTLQAQKGIPVAFVTSFKAGCVMGFSLVANGVLILYLMVSLFRLYYKDLFTDPKSASRMYEAVAGYGLGGSSIALFGRVGGGIYTKAADVGADLTGKIEFDIPEDDPRNPAVIADNVGDNVGDIAGMGADLFGSFAEATCAAMVITSRSPVLSTHWSYLCFPIMITASGIVVGIATSFFATDFIKTETANDVEPSLKRQILISTVLETPVVFLLCYLFLPHDKFPVSGHEIHYYTAFFCVIAGLWAGLIIGYITEYYTSHSYKPVREVAGACTTGAATDIIYGLALGYKSTIIPAFAMAVAVWLGLHLAGMYGIACAALGILSTMATGLTIDAFGPICDNAGGIAEMAGFDHSVRDKTDALDAAGNTTAAIGKGFAIGSAAFVSLALFGGFTVITKLDKKGVNILEPYQFAGLLVGAMLPYWFSAMTMKAVGVAAQGMVDEVRRQFREHPQILEGTMDPDYESCVKISTEASLNMMIAPGALVMGTPLVVGYIFGVKALAGVLAGALVSGVQMAISSANAGGAWDNAKKYIEAAATPEAQALGGKGSDAHKAAVVGDTVGDPMKDTSGPSLNILVKLSAIISLVFARSLMEVHGGEGLIAYL